MADELTNEQLREARAFARRVLDEDLTPSVGDIRLLAKAALAHHAEQAGGTEGWAVRVREDESQSWLEVTGPNGEGAAFSCDRGSVRAEVLQLFAIAQINASQQPEAAAPADDALWTLEDVGRAMVNMTTTVWHQSEWNCIPGLWQDCMEERDRLRAAEGEANA